MAISIEDRLEFLKKRQMFTGLEEEEVRIIAERMEEYTLPAGKNLFSQGDTGNVFYIIYRGSVRIWRLEPDEVGEHEYGILETGDKLGMEALLTGRPRATSATAAEDTIFLAMHKPDFEHMVDQYDSIYVYLETLIETRQMAREQQFHWLHSGEIVQIFSRRHPIQLYLDLLKPLVAVLLGGFFLFVASLTQLETIPNILGYFMLILAALWTVWEYLDWRNDLFILTNQRVVWLEKVIFQAASRREAPLAAVQSVDVRSSYIGRLLNYGNVLVRTYTGTGSLTLTNVNQPKQMKGEIEELLLRVRKKTEVVEEERLRHSIRQSLGLESREVEDPIFHIEPPDEVEGTIFTKLLRTREVSADGLTITYHRHWWVLLAKTWLHLLGFFGTLVFIVYAVISNFNVLGFQIPSLSLFVFGFGVMLVFAGMAAYHTADWNNDIYKITKDDTLIDSEKKPFGEEISRTAPIKNIISLEHNRIGILRLLLNFGMVKVVVADATLTFYDVHNPAQVQQDIYYRQEQIKLRQEETEMEQDRQHISRWLRAYHDVLQTEQVEEERLFSADFEDEDEEI